MSAPPPATIRLYNRSRDQKVTRYLIGAALMEPSSIANRYALWTIPSLLLCLAMSHLIVTNFTSGWLPPHAASFADVASYLTPSKDNFFHFALLVPIIVSPPIVLLAIFELRHRTLFEQEMKRGIGEEDLRDIEAYYRIGDDSTTREGLWVLEYDERIIGAVSVDGRNPAKALDSVVDAPPPPEDDSKAIEDSSSSSSTTATTTTSGYSLRQRNKTTGTPGSSKSTSSATSPPETLHIRRFTTSMSFRPADIEEDLLSHAAAIAFAPTSKLLSTPPAKRLVISLRPSLERSLLSKLVKLGFKPAAAGETIDYESEEARVIREEKEKKRGQILGGLLAVRDSVWRIFVDLDRKVWVLEKADWEKSQKK